MMLAISKCEVVLAKLTLGYLHLGEVVRHVADLDLGDVALAEQAVPGLFGELAQRPDIDVAVEGHLDDIMAAPLKAHPGLLGVIGEGADAIHRLFDVLKAFHPVRAGYQFKQDGAGAFLCRGGHLPDALEAPHGLFDGQ